MYIDKKNLKKITHKIQQQIALHFKFTKYKKNTQVDLQLYIALFFLQNTQSTRVVHYKSDSQSGNATVNKLVESLLCLNSLFKCFLYLFIFLFAMATILACCYIAWIEILLDGWRMEKSITICALHSSIFIQQLP